MDTSFLKQYAETRGFMLGRPQKPKLDARRQDRAVPARRGRRRRSSSSSSSTSPAGKTRELLTPETLLKGAEENLTPEEKARRERHARQRRRLHRLPLRPTTARTSCVPLSGKLYVVRARHRRR